jgi:hypothetical protein
MDIETGISSNQNKPDITRWGISLFDYQKISCGEEGLPWFNSSQVTESAPCSITKWYDSDHFHGDNTHDDSHHFSEDFEMLLEKLAAESDDDRSQQFCASVLKLLGFQWQSTAGVCIALHG